MNTHRLIQTVACGFLMLLGTQSKAQTIASDFSWANTSNLTTSTHSFTGCDGETINATLTSSPMGHKLVGTGAYFPFNADNGGDVDITLTFSTPVTNFRLLINDFDEHAPGGFDDGSPSEYGANVTPFFTSIDPVAGSPTFTDFVAPNDSLDPSGGENTKGWVNWAGPITTVSFTYARPDAGMGEGGWGLLLDSLMFDCPPSIGCLCDRKYNYFESSPTYIPANGNATAIVKVNSNGEALSKLNISVPYHASLIEPDCIECDPEGVNLYGTIRNLPSIAGVAPTYVSSSGSQSSEITYEFPTPTVVNQSVILNLVFPPALNLSCCRNKVEYCVKIQMIDPKCEICEILLCSKEGSSGKSAAPTDAPINVTALPANFDVDNGQFNPSKTNAIQISPNPVNDNMTIEFPAAGGQVAIYSLTGKSLYEAQVNAKKMRISTSEFEPGTYLVKYTYNNQVTSQKFVKQ